MLMIKILVIVTNLSLAAAIHSAGAVDWIDVRRKLNIYLASGTLNDAHSFMSSIPITFSGVEWAACMKNRDCADSLTALVMEIEEHDLVEKNLKRRMLSGQEPAVLVGFTITRFVEAAPAEEISGFLGEVASTHPAIFIKAVQSLPWDKSELCAVVPVLGDRFVDHVDAMKKELARRRVALNAVKGLSKDGERVKEICLMTLKKEEKKLSRLDVSP